jgi:hypothetical protein
VAHRTSGFKNPGNFGVQIVRHASLGLRHEEASHPKQDKSKNESVEKNAIHKTDQLLKQSSAILSD